MKQAFFHWTKTPLVELDQTLLTKLGVEVSVKRLDLNHPVYGGNKLLKLWPLFSRDKDELKSRGVISMGGPHSNHLFSLAGLCHELKVPLTVIVRGERPLAPTYVIRQLEKWGTELRFVSRDEFRDWRENGASMASRVSDAIWLPEGGGDGKTNDAFKNLMEEWYEQGLRKEDHLVLASGTGGTLAGLVPHIEKGQHILLINAVPNFPVTINLEKWCGEKLSGLNIEILETSGLGRFGTVTDDLVKFAWNWQSENRIPLDPIYTARIFFTIWQLLKDQRGTFSGKRLSVLHTGGMAGAFSWEHKTGMEFIPRDIRPDI